MLIVGRLCPVEAESIWETSVLSTLFFCEPKNVLKKQNLLTTKHQEHKVAGSGNNSSKSSLEEQMWEVKASETSSMSGVHWVSIN